MAHIKNIMEKYCQNIVPQILRYDGLFQLREFLATHKDSWPLSASDQIGPFSCVGETQFWNCGKWSKAVNERKVKVTFKSWVLGYSSLSHDRWLSSEKFICLKFELSLGLYLVFSSVHVNGLRIEERKPLHESSKCYTNSTQSIVKLSHCHCGEVLI